MAEDEKALLDIEKNTYPWCGNPAEFRRCFILEKVCGMEIAPDALLRFMASLDTWIVDGKIPGMGDLKKLATVSK